MGRFGDGFEKRVRQTNHRGKRIPAREYNLYRSSNAGMPGRILSVCPRMRKKGRMSCDEDTDLTRGFQRRLL